jgi:L-alanine-DL-glutamate epimerase-like enolase superfamily enzyme
MLDESLDGPASIAWLVASRAAPLAHLKLAKLGGLDRLMAAGRALQTAGIGVMVGQMNEGTPSTLAAAHAALALDAPWRELYGADGLQHDPAGLPTYARGELCLPQGTGIGVADVTDDGQTLWETTT